MKLKSLETVADYRNIPIPIVDNPATTRDYRQVRVNLASREARESLVDLGSIGIAGESYYSRHDGFNAPYYRPLAAALKRVYCRQTVATKLLSINQRLERYGLEIFAWDGYRSIACQQDLWNHFVEQARLNGMIAEEDIVNYASEYCSDPRGYNPRDSMTWPTHITGGAIDLTLRRSSSGELLFMGGIFDDPSRVSHTSYFETLAESLMTLSDFEARRNRRLLYWTMKASGFANYAYEWWHFDWGNQMWMVNRNPYQAIELIDEAAFYGPADHLLPESNS